MSRSSTIAATFLALARASDGSIHGRVEGGFACPRGVLQAWCERIIAGPGDGPAPPSVSLRCPPAIAAAAAAARRATIPMNCCEVVDAIVGGASGAVVVCDCPALSAVRCGGGPMHPAAVAACRCRQRRCRCVHASCCVLCVSPGVHHFSRHGLWSWQATAQHCWPGDESVCCCPPLAARTPCSVCTHIRIVFVTRVSCAVALACFADAVAQQRAPDSADWARHRHHPAPEPRRPRWHTRKCGGD